MSIRRTYPYGVPCWVAVLDPDVQIARQFYAAVFGWEFHDVAEQDAPFLIATKNGDPVASVTGPEPRGTWITAVAVRDLDTAIAHARETGGSAPGPPIDIPTLGRFHRLLDPAGAEIHVARLVDGGGAARVNEPAAWAMSELQTAEISAVTAFYESVFGWKAEEAEGTTLFRLPGYVGGKKEQPVPRDVVAIATISEEAVTPVWRPEFWVLDTDRAVAAAAENGGRVVTSAQNTDMGFRSAVLADPGGAVFAVSQLLDGDNDGD